MPMQVPQRGHASPVAWSASEWSYRRRVAFMYAEPICLMSVSPPVISAPFSDPISASNFAGGKLYGIGATRAPAASSHIT